MKLVLVGYMGSGKTTTGKILAERLGIPFIDLDHYISEKLGMSITDLFKNKGAVFFRKVEREALLHLGHSDDSFVLSTGGGTPCFGDNLENMKVFPNTIVVYLKLSIPELVTRLEGEMDQRPLLAGLDKAPFTVEEISAKIGELLTGPEIKAEVEIVYQTIENLHLACPENLGDWYFTGEYPTPGGNRVVNRAFVNFFEGKNERAY